MYLFTWRLLFSKKLAKGAFVQNKKFTGIFLKYILSLFLIISCSCSVFAKDTTILINLNIQHKSLDYILNHIALQANVHMLYKDADILQYSDESIFIKNQTIQSSLEKILKGKPLEYMIKDSVIIIKNKDNKITYTTRVGSNMPSTQESYNIHGVVSDSAGIPLQGVTVKVKETGAATFTNSTGNFSLKVNKGFTVVISMIGYVPQNIVVYDDSPIKIILQTQNKNLEDIVVTALGISRKKSSVVYDVAEVKGSEFTQARENNVANALTGKIAGVNATGISTGPGGSSRVIIRGNGSLTGANQPLYVINGMPIDNTVPGGSATTNGLTGNVDRGDGIGGINPDDIESMSVLKGGAAAALYGSRAANGVILITTKKGASQKGLGITYNAGFVVDKIAVHPDWQYEYGQGDNGEKPTTQEEAIATGRHSFGAKIDGSTYIAADGKEHPYTAQKNNVDHFYQSGRTLNNTVAFSGGTEKVTYRFSMMDLNSQSILPGSKFDRKTFNLNVAGNLSKRLSINAMAQYNYEKGTNRPTAGDALGNPNWLPYMAANTVDVRWFKPGYDSTGTEIPWNDANIASNGYFVINKFQENDDKNRFIGQISVNYKILDNLELRGVVSNDFYNYNFHYILPYGTLYIPYGRYQQIKSDLSETNSLLTATYNAKLGSSFSLTAMAGVNKRNFSNKEMDISGQNYIVPFFYSLTNLQSYSSIPLTQKTVTNSSFGSLDVSFKDFAFLSFTGRNDWFSTLSPQYNSIFYPSVGGSVLLNRIMHLPTFINYLKLRGSWARVGGAPPDPYAINPSFTMVPSSTVPLQNVSSTTITNKDLRPLLSTTTEAGFEAQMLKSRLSIDFTLYEKKTTNDIVTTAVSVASGYNNAILNAGAVSNKGIELLLTGKIIDNKNFKWTSSYNFSYNKNEVEKLTTGLDLIQLGAATSGGGYVDNMVGKPYGVIVGTTMEKDTKGNIVFDKNTGFPVISALTDLGQGVPPYTMGFSNEFSYKRFSFSFLLDGKFGNKIFSVMDVYATRMGLTKMTLPGRENGLTVNGVDQDGNAYSRTIPVSSLRSWYDNYKSYSNLFLQDGSFVKLRQIIFTYKFPEFKKNAIVKNASVSIVARDPFILYKKTDDFDPEASITNGAAQGIESFGLPRTRNIGINLMVGF